MDSSVLEIEKIVVQWKNVYTCSSLKIRIAFGYFLLTVYWGHGGAGIEGGGDSWRKWSGCSFQEVGIHANDCDIVGDDTNFVNGGKDSDSPTKAL